MNSAELVAQIKLVLNFAEKKRRLDIDFFISVIYYHVSLKVFEVKNLVMVTNFLILIIPKSIF